MEHFQNTTQEGFQHKQELDFQNRFQHTQLPPDYSAPLANHSQRSSAHLSWDKKRVYLPESSAMSLNHDNRLKVSESGIVGGSLGRQPHLGVIPERTRASYDGERRGGGLEAPALERRHERSKSSDYGRSQSMIQQPSSHLNFYQPRSERASLDFTRLAQSRPVSKPDLQSNRLDARDVLSASRLLVRNASADNLLTTPDIQRRLRKMALAGPPPAPEHMQAERKMNRVFSLPVITVGNVQEQQRRQHSVPAITVTNPTEPQDDGHFQDTINLNVDSAREPVGSNDAHEPRRMSDTDQPRTTGNVHDQLSVHIPPWHNSRLQRSSSDTRLHDLTLRSVNHGHNQTITNTDVIGGVTPNDVNDDHKERKEDCDDSGKGSEIASTVFAPGSTTGKGDVQPAGSRFAWDIPRSIPTRSPPGCCHGFTGAMLRTMKVCAYIVMFFGVLGGAVVSQAVLVTEAKRLGQSLDAGSSGKRDAGFAAGALVLMLYIPVIVRLLISLWRVALGNRLLPPLAMLLKKCVLEGLHMLGILILVFHLLPNLHPLQGLTYMVALSLLPSLAGLVSSLRAARVPDSFKSVLVVLLQGGSIGLCVAFIFLDNEDLGLASEPRDHELTLKSEGRIALYARAAATALLLCSRWLLNYVEKPGGKREDKGGLGLNNYDVGSSVSVDGDASETSPAAAKKNDKAVDRERERDKDRDKRAVLPLILSAIRLVVCVVYCAAYEFLQDAFHVLVTTAEPTVSFVTSPGCNFINFTSLPPTTPVIVTTDSSYLSTNSSYLTTANSSYLTTAHSSYQTTPASSPESTTTDYSLGSSTLTLLNENVTTLANASTTGASNNLTNLSSLCNVNLLFSSATDDVWVRYGCCLVQVLACAICYHLAITACRLRMQRTSFSLPLTLAPLATFALFTFCGSDWAVVGNWGASGFAGNVEAAWPERSLRWWITVGAFLAGWISNLLLASHVFTHIPPDRLTFTDRLFHTPLYCSPMAALSLLHGRRRPSGPSSGRRPSESSSGSQHMHTDVTSGSKNEPITLYMCATMWHETKEEMRKLINSILRFDINQTAETILVDRGIDSGKVYNFEAHIFFDDAYEGLRRKRKPNAYACDLVDLLDPCVSEMLGVQAVLKPPVKTGTPYGLKVTWTMPGRNLLVVHFKDSQRIRNKKRWSQVMYMYYLLGYNLLEKNSHVFTSTSESSSLPTVDNLPSEVLQQAERTFILALDGDVDFRPRAIHLLVDRMKKNPHVAAACGRIKPLGTGPVVWYQKFEYAIGHWLQKCAEHVYGCVLCAPGCFSLFRARALLDDNVMRTYASNATQARHTLQYDQGEDRWLCTLLLQQGHRIEYCAVSVALTFAPTRFGEFFNQRRRWGPSTMANVLDLLMSRRKTVSRNASISTLYMLYLVVLFVSSAVGPATVLLAMESSMREVFNLATWLAFLLTLGPTAIFVIVCLRCKADTQLKVAMVLSTLYALVMMAVITGTFVSLAREGWYTPNAIFLYVLAATFLLSGLLHPHELPDLLWGLLYFVCIPAGYLFLVVYAVCNLHVVSWGTRESRTANEQQQEWETGDGLGGEPVPASVHLQHAAKSLRRRMEEDERGRQQNANRSCFGLVPAFFRRMQTRMSTNVILLFILEALNRVVGEDGTESRAATPYDLRSPNTQSILEGAIGAGHGINDAADSPQSKHLLVFNGRGEEKLEEKEERFWACLIAKYLRPTEPGEKEQQHQKLNRQMRRLRNDAAFAFFFLNGLWLAVMAALQEVRHELVIEITDSNGKVYRLEPMGLFFIGIFCILLLLQIVAMIRHRYGALLHILAFTPLRRHSRQQQEELERRRVLEALHPDPDYDDDDNDDPHQTLPSHYNGFLNATPSGQDGRPFPQPISAAVGRKVTQQNNTNNSNPFQNQNGAPGNHIPAADIGHIAEMGETFMGGHLHSSTHNDGRHGHLYTKGGVGGGRHHNRYMKRQEQHRQHEFQREAGGQGDFPGYLGQASMRGRHRPVDLYDTFRFNTLKNRHRITPQF